MATSKPATGPCTVDKIIPSCRDFEPDRQFSADDRVAMSENLRQLVARREAPQLDVSVVQMELAHTTNEIETFLQQNGEPP